MTAMPPTISLVITTLARSAEVHRLLESLSRQRFTDFDVVVVDQNDDDRLCSALAEPWPFTLNHLRTPGARGASRGRNTGWRACEGRIVLFPDDDSWYAPDFLENAIGAMQRQGCDVLAGRAADELTGRSINGRFENHAQPIDRRNVWTTAIEWMVFFRREVLVATGGFDEEIGIGAATPWQSSEIQDILLRAMARRYSCWFDPAVAGHHKEILLGRPDEPALRKARGYARGLGYVMRLHGYPVGTLAAWVARPVGSAALGLRGKDGWRRLSYYGQIVLGRLEGTLRRTTGGRQ